MPNSKILLIIPCFNEQKSIIPLLEEIAAIGANFSTVVIDDGSIDSTYENAKKLSPTVRLLKNLGIGGAVQTGIKYALNNGFNFCIQIDGDGQHPPSEIFKLLRCYENRPSSIVIGSRYLFGSGFKSTFARRFGGRAIAWALNTFFSGSSLSDPTSGIRLMDRNAIRFFSESYPHDYPEPISLAWALQAGLTVNECGVQMRSRNSGQSSIGGWKPIGYMLRVLGYIILARIIRPKSR
jgi:glycosyltransferase involved in cell wall biosynthesis